MTNIFENNILLPTDTMLALKGFYVTSKDEKVILEVREINQERRITVNLRGITDPVEAKKFAEILSFMLINKNGYFRNMEEIEIKNSNEEAEIIIKL